MSLTNEGAQAPASSVGEALNRVSASQSSPAVSALGSGLDLKWWREALAVAPAILRSASSDEAAGGSASLDRLPPPAAAFGRAVALSTASDALRASAARGSTAEVRRLLEKGAAPDTASRHDLLLRTALHAASAGGHEGACKAILKHTAAQSQEQASEAAARLSGLREADGLTRSAAAAAVARARGLLGRLLDAQDTMGCTALALSARGGHAAVCKLLLLQGADPAIEDEDAVSPESAAAEAGHQAALGVLQEPSVLFWNASVRANRLYAERRYNEAIGAYSAALDLAASAADGLRASRRDLATLHYNRARAAFRLGLHVAAVEDCGEALDQDDSYRNALAQRAECHMSLFDFERAAKDFRALLDADPADRQWARRLLEAERMRDLSHYQVLGLPATFSGGQLKRAYRTACLRWHPDKHSTTAEAGHRAHVVFRRVTTAYEVLKDSYQRTLHDMDIRARGQDPGGAGGASRFEDWASKEAGRDAERDAERMAADTNMQAEAASLALGRRAAREALSSRARTAASASSGSGSGPASEAPASEAGGSKRPAWLPMALGAGGLAELAEAIARESSGGDIRPPGVTVTSVQATQTTPTVSGRSKRVVPAVAPPPLPEALRGVGAASDTVDTPSPAKSTSSSASRRSGLSSSTRRAAEQAEAFLRRVQEREEARWRSETVDRRGYDAADSARQEVRDETAASHPGVGAGAGFDARTGGSDGASASPRDTAHASRGLASAEALPFAEPAEAKEAAPSPHRRQQPPREKERSRRRSPESDAKARGGDAASDSSPRTAARMRVEARVRGRVQQQDEDAEHPALPLHVRAAARREAGLLESESEPFAGQALPPGLNGFVHQLDVLDAEIREMMGPRGSLPREFEGGDESVASSEDDDATHDEYEEDDGEEEHDDDDGGVYADSDGLAFDDGEDLERAFGYARDPADGAAWGSSPAARGPDLRAGRQEWPVSSRASEASSAALPNAFSPKPSATPRTHEAARKAAEAAFAPDLA